MRSKLVRCERRRMDSKSPGAARSPPAAASASIGAAARSAVGEFVHVAIGKRFRAASFRGMMTTQGLGRGFLAGRVVLSARRFARFDALVDEGNGGQIHLAMRADAPAQGRAFAKLFFANPRRPLPIVAAAPQMARIVACDVRAHACVGGRALDGFQFIGVVGKVAGLAVDLARGFDTAERVFEAFYVYVNVARSLPVK